MKGRCSNGILPLQVSHGPVITPSHLVCFSSYPVNCYTVLSMDNIRLSLTQESLFYTKDLRWTER